MSPCTATRPAAPYATPAGDSHQATARLLTAGIAAGPLFLTVWAAQAFTRTGFDPSRHPLSLLSLGNLGWIQIANFVVTGALYLAYAAGLRRVLRTGRGAIWAPRLVAAIGTGLIMAGIFLTDAGAGYPTGAPAGKPDMSWHGALHELGFTIVLLSWTIGCLVFRRRFTALRQPGWARACLACVIAAIVIGAWPDINSFSIRIVVATAVQFGFLAAVAVHLNRALPVRSAGALSSDISAGEPPAAGPAQIMPDQQTNRLT